MKVLIVEDNLKLAERMKAGLMQEGFVVDTLHNGLEAEKRLLISQADYDVVVLDLMLPDMDGMAICRSWREHDVTVPILMLTARDGTADKVKGLDSGADDYLAKPFDFEELLARIRALLRRPPVATKSIMTIGRIALDTVSRRVTLAGEEVVLTLKEYMVLEYLMRNCGKVLTRDTLYDHAWDYADAAFSNTINVHIKNLRRKLHDDGKLIQTIRGVGYKME